MSAFTQEDYDALCRTIASGSLEVRYGDRTEKYRSLDEMMRIKKMMAEELGITRRPNRVIAAFDKGFAR